MEVDEDYSPEREKGSRLSHSSRRRLCRDERNKSPVVPSDHSPTVIKTELDAEPFIPQPEVSEDNVVQSSKSHPKDPVFSSKHCITAFLNLWSMRQKGQLCDIAIKNGNYIVLAHKAVLGSVSPFFLRSCTTGVDTTKPQPSPITFAADFPVNIITSVIKFMYTGSIFLTPQNVEQSYDLFTEWEMEEGLKLCTLFKTKIESSPKKRKRSENNSHSETVTSEPDDVYTTTIKEEKPEDVDDDDDDMTQDESSDHDESSEQPSFEQQSDTNTDTNTSTSTPTTRKYNSLGRRSRRCKECKVMINEASYIDHIKECSRLSICGLRFQDRESYKSHIKVCGLKHFPVCEECNEVCISDQALSRHKRKFHPIELNCEICNQKFTSKKLFSFHNKQNHATDEMGNPRLYQCKEDECSYESTDHNNFARHMKVVHTTDPIPCDVCGRIMKNKHHLRSHRRSHEETDKLNTCDVCGDTFVSKQSLKDHKRKKHENAPPDYLCSICGFQTYGKNSITGHMFNKHHVLPKSKNKGHTCPHCGWKTMQRTQMDTHILRHTATERNFECDQCQKKFVTEADLKKHRLNHDPSKKKYKCPHCSYATIGKAKLDSHIQRLHENKEYKPWGCQECDYRTNLKGNLTAHLKRKHGLHVKTTQHTVSKIATGCSPEQPQSSQHQVPEQQPQQQQQQQPQHHHHQHHNPASMPMPMPMPIPMHMPMYGPPDGMPGPSFLPFPNINRSSEDPTNSSIYR